MPVEWNPDTQACTCTTQQKCSKHMTDKPMTIDDAAIDRFCEAVRYKDNEQICTMIRALHADNERLRGELEKYSSQQIEYDQHFDTCHLYQKECNKTIAKQRKLLRDALTALRGLQKMSDLTPNNPHPNLDELIDRIRKAIDK